MRRSAVLVITLLSTCSQSPAPPAPVATPQAQVPEVSVNDLPRALPLRCPADMAEVEGDYCPQAEETCARWSKSPAGKKVCAEFVSPTRCLTPEARRPHKHFCIDRYEWPNIEGLRPRSWLTWKDAVRETHAIGKRLCTETEWAMACEGPDMQPYPYGTGYVRDSTACNIDNPLPAFDISKAKRPSDPVSLQLQAMLSLSGADLRCVSPWDVHDMVGNIDEWVVNESGKPFKSALMSGHVFGVRNRCRAVTTRHGTTFSWYETGTRACKDVD